MARIRTIKPEFWTHEDLSALPEATHMLAAALLNHADDEGYFNANPGLVRAACCPLREPSVSVQDSLSSLSSVGYLMLGTGADGKRYGRIVKFDDHQRVNRPTPSKIKALPIVWDNSSTTHCALSEDSPPERNREQGTGKGEKLDSSAGADPSGGKVRSIDACPHEAIIDLFHEILPANPRIKTWSETRRSHLRSRWREDAKRQSLDYWARLFRHIAGSEFLTGRVQPAPGKPPFFATLDWLVMPENFAKVIEGRYHSRSVA